MFSMFTIISFVIPAALFFGSAVSVLETKVNKTTGSKWPVPDFTQLGFDRNETVDIPTAVTPVPLDLNTTLMVKPSANATLLDVVQVCNTEACNVTAKRMLSAMNSSADPCDDFFTYACGGWIAEHPIPDNETEASMFKSLSEKTKRLVEGMLDKNYPHMFESEVKAKRFFMQCKNQRAIEEMRAKPLIELLDKEIGGWPILNKNWDASKFDLFEALLKTHMHGDDILFGIDVGQDLEIPSKNLLYIGEPETMTTKDVLQSDAGKLVTESYIQYIFNVTSLLLHDAHDTRNVSEVSNELMDIIDFSRFLTLGQMGAVEKRDMASYKNKTTLGANQKHTFTRSTFARNLTDYVRAIFAEVDMADMIQDNSTVVIRSTVFFDRLDEKLKELEELGDEGKRRLANYIGWRVITSNIKHISQDYRDAFEEHQQRIQGQKTKKEKTAAERCAGDLKMAMPLAIGAMYVRDYIPADLKPKASMMVADIKNGFQNLLEVASWMDNATLNTALDKLSGMLNFVGYPDELTQNITAVDEEYSEMHVGENYFETVQELSKVQVMKNLKKLPKDNKRWDPIDDAMDITGVNAFNLVTKNIIVVLAAPLQQPFYDAQVPQYINYGGVSFFLGHEVTHGFDDQGSSFDTQGLMRTWWSNTTKKLYDEKKQGFVEQYGNYSLSLGKVSGQLTLGENIADNGGLKAAYRGYFDHFRQRVKGDPEPLLPGMTNFTAEQLFFLSAGQVWCSTHRPESSRLDLLTDEHSPSKFRVVGPLSNMDEFAKAYKCPAGSKMNPKHKYSVW